VTHVDILEVGKLCARMRSASLDLFEVIGGWVTSSDDPVLQRAFAVASHRHAWHAELWLDRMPAIPGVIDERISARWPALADVARTERGAVYAAALADLVAELQAVADRLDATLDPSTRRVVDLMVADLIDIQSGVEPALG
jgi:hypothetical protein